MAGQMTLSNGNWLSLMKRLLSGLFQGAENRESELRLRVQELSGDIATRPDAPAPYVLRGELRVELGDVELAREDFNTAVALADSVDGSKEWGLLKQAMRDRALMRLKHLKRRL